MDEMKKLTLLVEQLKLGIKKVCVDHPACFNCPFNTDGPWCPFADIENSSPEGWDEFAVAEDNSEMWERGKAWKK